MRFLFSATVLVASVAIASAQVSYDTPNGQGQAAGGSYDYWDQTYTGSGSPAADLSPLSGGLGQLTDGGVGADDWGADLGSGNAYEWVGWRTVDPTITLDYGSVVAIDSIDVHTNNLGTGGVSLWDSIAFTFSDDGITFSGLQTRTATATERADTSARFLSTDLGMSARYVRMAVSRFQGDWVFISEIRTNPVPEPATVAGLGLGALALLRRRR